MHVRSSLLVGVTAATLLVTACSSGDDDPTTLPAVSPSETSATPNAIPVPEAAQAHTEEGAVAFVEHYLDALNSTYLGNDVEAGVAALREGSEPTCGACNGWIASVENTWLADGRVEGADATTVDVVAGPGTLDADGVLVFAVLDARAGTLYRADGSVYAQADAVNKGTLRFDLRWGPGWTVNEVTVEQT